jgi:hypothetical protein
VRGDERAALAGTPREARANYGGALYGSLLAGSVVVGAAAGASGDYHVRPLQPVVLLVTTGLVFWLAHASSARQRSLSGCWAEATRRRAGVALAVAITAQVGWATVATLRAESADHWCSLPLWSTWYWDC